MATMQTKNVNAAALASPVRILGPRSVPILPLRFTPTRTRRTTTTIHAVKYSNKEGLTELRKGFRDVAEGGGDGGEGNSTSYGVLAGLYGFSAGFYALFPHVAAELNFGEAGRPHDYLHEPLFRIWAIGITTAAIALWVQRGAAKDGNLDEDTHRRLNAALSFFAAANLGLQAVSFATNPIVNGPAAAVLGLVAAATWWVVGRNYAKYSPEGANPIAILQSYGKDISTLGKNDGLISTLYAALTAGFIGAGFAYLFAPVPTLNAVVGLTAGKGPEDIFLWQLIGAGLATLVGPIAFTEREAANNNIFSDPTNRVLNLGLGVASWAHVAVLLPLVGTEQAGPLALPLTAFWGVAGLTTSLIAAFPK